MEVRKLTSAEDLALYDIWVRLHPEGSLWQSLEWAQFQNSLGRTTKIYALVEGQKILASALVVVDRTTFGFSTWDIPRGPLSEMVNDKWSMINGGAASMLLETIVADAKQDRCLSMTFSPAIPLIIDHSPLNIHVSGRHEQPTATRILDLTLSEEEILKQMKPKGRYNISVAQKHGVVTLKSDDAAAFHRLLTETAGRDGFRVRPQRHYQALLEAVKGSFLLLAYADSSHSQPIAGLLGVQWGKTGIYYYGASAYASRALMAPYALQWEAMRLCKAAGCTQYDLLGIAPPDAGPEHPWAGVSGFKEKFGGRVVEYPQEQEIVLKPMMKKVLEMKRKLLG